MSNEANIYPNCGKNPTIGNSDDSRANLGFCFSGGGSRALTCAWGQLLGVNTLGLAEKPRYISSVSGGTWASSIYTYLPATIGDDDLLGQYYLPKDLSLNGEGDTFNVNNLGQYSYGQAPAGTSLENLAVWSALFMLTYAKTDYKRMWASIVSEFILKPFGLQFEGTSQWTSSKYFSLSLSYTNDFFPQNSPPKDDFIFVKSGRPFLIMNDNIMEKVPVQNADDSNIVQLPNQATPVSAGAKGVTPDRTINGNGSVESYAHNSHLDQDSAGASPVNVSINQPYSLIDSVSTSSAFFAEAIASYVQDIFKDDKKRAQLIQNIKKEVKKKDRMRILNQHKENISDVGAYLEKSLEDLAAKDAVNLDAFIPTYNYWPIGNESKNQEIQYTDGGTLDNTGILGMLSQTKAGDDEAVLNIVVFDNTSTPLVKKGSNIIAASQAAPLFGIDFDISTGVYHPYTSEQQDPTNNAFDATSLITVFDNTADASGKTPFDKLVSGLYATNCGASPGMPPDDSKINTAPAFCQQQFTTVANSLASVSVERKVNMLYIQNAKILNWQEMIGDENLQKEIAAGQNGSLDPFTPFKDFPNYNTFFKIGLTAKESNALSQMWAWAIADDASPLKVPFKSFINSASESVAVKDIKLSEIEQ